MQIDGIVLIVKFEFYFEIVTIESALRSAKRSKVWIKEI